MIERVNLIEPVAAGVTPAQAVRAMGRWGVRFSNPQRRRKTGTIYGWETWEDRFKNIVVNQGLDDLLDVTLSGGTQDTTHFIGLTDGTPTPAAGDTLASHAGWAEVTAYDEAARQAYVDAGVSAQSITNSASPAAFTISADATTIGGAFLAGDNTKGGTTGRIYAVGALGSGDVVLNDGATLDITATFTQAAA